METRELTATEKMRKKEEKMGKLFLGGMAALSIMGGFGYAFAMTKKSDPRFFLKGFTIPKNQKDSGASLAVRALGWGSLIAVGGVSALSYGIWKLMGVNNLKEMREKCEKIFPRVPRNDPPLTRTEFDSFRDLFDYIIQEDDKNKKLKNRPKDESSSETLPD